MLASGKAVGRVSRWVITLMTRRLTRKGPRTDWTKNPR